MKRKIAHFPGTGKVPSQGLLKWGLRYLSHPNNGAAGEVCNVIMRRRANFCGAKSSTEQLAVCLERENANRQVLRRRWKRAIARAVPERVTGTERSDRSRVVTDL